LLSADRVHISFVLQLGGDNEYVTLCDPRQTHEDQTSRHHGAICTNARNPLSSKFAINF